MKVQLDAYLNADKGPHGTTYYAGLEHERPAVSVIAYSEAEAKRKLKRDVLNQLSQAVAAERYWQRYIIGTASGCVVTVSYRHGWEYVVSGPGQRTGALCISQSDYESTLSKAKEHASQLGGIVWEHSF